MDKETFKSLMTFGAIVGTAGLIILLFSVNIGLGLSHSWLNSQGGMADTHLFETVTKSYTTAIIIIGGVLFALGSAVITAVQFIDRLKPHE